MLTRGEGVKKPENLADIICERPLISWLLNISPSTLIRLFLDTLDASDTYCGFVVMTDIKRECLETKSMSFKERLYLCLWVVLNCSCR